LCYTIFFNTFQLQLLKTEPKDNFNIQNASQSDTDSVRNAEMNILCDYKQTMKNLLGIRHLKILVARQNLWGQQGVRKHRVGEGSSAKYYIQNSEKC
jgi:hypothetical protein